MIRLYTHPDSSAARRVEIALELKGLTYESICTVPSADASYRRLNPQCLLPMLDIDGERVAQSLAIIEWLEERFPAPALLPAPPLLRARARAFAQAIVSDLHPLNNRRVRSYLREGFAASVAAVDAWYRHWVREAFAGLESELRDRQHRWRYCFSDEPGLADICLIPQIAKARACGCDLAPYEALLGVEKTCLEQRAFRASGTAAGSSTDDVVCR